MNVLHIIQVFTGLENLFSYPNNIAFTTVFRTATMLTRETDIGYSNPQIKGVLQFPDWDTPRKWEARNTNIIPIFKSNDGNAHGADGCRSRPTAEDLAAKSDRSKRRKKQKALPKRIRMSPFAPKKSEV